MRNLVTIAALAAAGALALAACGDVAGDGGDAGGSPGPAETAQPEAQPAVETTGDEEADQFLGLTLDGASALAERQGRQWRVAREDGEEFALTADLIDGRVTFEVDNGIVTVATVEHADEVDTGAVPPEDADRAALLAAAVERLVTVDNSFGGGDPFDRIDVARSVGGDASEPLGPLALELIAAALEPVAKVVFIDDPEAAIAEYFDAATPGVAVVTVDDVRVDGDRAEVDVGLWCGNVCGIWLTYEAELGTDGWEILGTTGPIAIS
jgi:hypothetical protein